MWNKIYVLRKARIDAFHNSGIDKIYDLSGSDMKFAMLVNIQPQRGFTLLAVHWFIEIPNIKLQITNNFQWPKFKNPNNVSPWKVLVIEYCNLRFIWDLALGICNFRHKNPRQSHLSLTWPKVPGFSGYNKFYLCRSVLFIWFKPDNYLHCGFDNWNHRLIACHNSSR